MREVSPTLLQTISERGSLSEQNGLLKRGNQIVIPLTLRSEMLERIHHGHLGLNKCQERYRDAIWWPKISQAVKDKVL